MSFSLKSIIGTSFRKTSRTTQPPLMQDNNRNNNAWQHWLRVHGQNCVEVADVEQRRRVENDVSRSQVFRFVLLSWFSRSFVTAYQWFNWQLRRQSALETCGASDDPSQTIAQQTQLDFWILIPAVLTLLSIADAIQALIRFWSCDVHFSDKWKVLLFPPAYVVWRGWIRPTAKTPLEWTYLDFLLLYDRLQSWAHYTMCGICFIAALLSFTFGIHGCLLAIWPFFLTSILSLGVLGMPFNVYRQLPRPVKPAFQTLLKQVEGELGGHVMTPPVLSPLRLLPPPAPSEKHHRVEISIARIGPPLPTVSTMYERSLEETWELVRKSFYPMEVQDAQESDVEWRFAREGQLLDTLRVVLGYALNENATEEEEQAYLNRVYPSYQANEAALMYRRTRTEITPLNIWLQNGLPPRARRMLAYLSFKNLLQLHNLWTKESTRCLVHATSNQLMSELCSSVILTYLF